MPFTECQSYIKSAKDTESRAKLKPDCTAEFADVLIAVQSAPYFLNPGLTGWFGPSEDAYVSEWGRSKGVAKILSLLHSIPLSAYHTPGDHPSLFMIFTQNTRDE